jgi:hypothetical protein
MAMSAQAAPATPDVLERVLRDPEALVERIVRQVLEQLALSGGLPGTSDDAPEDALAIAVGNRIARLIADDAPAAPEEPAQYVALLDRDCTLAAALGACECWGEYVDCPVCDGDGGPGWLVPDPRLFARYVHPAVRAVTGRPAPRRAPRARKERVHAQRLSR